MTTPSCIFCAIGAGSVPAEIIAENDRAVAFLDVHPHAPGHTVVVPRAHAAALGDLAPGDRAPLFDLALEAAALLRRVLGAEGVTVGVNDGAVAGQAVPHVHIHVLPRFPGDGGGSVHSIVKNAPRGTVAEIAERIRAVPLDKGGK